MVRRAAAWVSLTAAALCAGGCDSVVEPIKVKPDCPQQPLRGPMAAPAPVSGQLIDDFELLVDGGIWEPLHGNGQRDGQWDYGWDLYGNVQGTHGQSAECVADGNLSGHFLLSSTTGWGQNWTAVFMAAGPGGTAVSYDARAWGGISFWAAFGGKNGPDFPVPVGVTTIDNAWNGRVCTTCEDFYATTVPLTHAWRRYEIRFGDLAQVGWGIPQVKTMRLDQAVGFIIQPSAEQNQYDIWIDDVRFEP
jgi:hypothetical protein